MDRADAAGLGVAAAGHLALLAALSLGFAASKLPEVRSTPIEVAFVDEIGLESTAPVPTQQPPAALAGPVDLPPDRAMPDPPAVQPLPAPSPIARSQPRVEPRPAPRPAPTPPQTKVRRNTGGLNSVVAGLSERETDSRSIDPPAAQAGPEVQASIRRMVRDELRPFWNSPSGADAELLRTELSIWLGRDGSVTRVEVIGTTGVTPSNRPQVKLHQEQAVKAVKLASPFNLPERFYDAWKHLSPIGFDRKLSR